MVDSLRLLPDVPWGERPTGPGRSRESDGLRFQHYAEILARAALDTPEPFTIGVFGGWGSGKTSLMRMMKEAIDAEPSAVSVWFNPWRYEKEEHLIVPLLATIISEMKEQQSKWTDMRDAGNKLMNAFRSVLYGVSVKGKIAVPGLSEAELALSPKDILERYKAVNQELATDRFLEMSLYFRAFGELDGIAGKSGGPKLIIFIDDLDRCFPDKAVALLESIKLVLNQPNIAFVMGIAQEIIQAYLQNKYKKEFGVPEELYEDYLEKLIQLAFHIPDIGENVEAFIRGLLEREEVFGRISRKQFKEEYEPLVSICGPACKNNPRAIVRFLNLLLVMKMVHETREKSEQESEDLRLKISLVHFGITIALRLKWPRILEVCNENPDVIANGTDKNRGPLCTYLVSLLQRDTKDEEDHASGPALRGEAERVKDEGKQVLSALAADLSLRQLLSSKPGLDWLGRPDLRVAAMKVAEEVQTKTPRPRVSSVADFFEAIPATFNKEATKGLEAVYQYEITGDGGGNWWVEIRDGEVVVSQGEHDAPGITITIDAKDYIDIIEGKLNEQMAFMSGKMKIKGDMNLAMKMKSIFHGTGP